MAKEQAPKLPYTREHLHDPAVRSFTGDSLARIAFPLGGIGTGTISLGGRGNLDHWEIFNSPNKNSHPPYTLPVIWAREAGGKPFIRVLERRILPPFEASFGLNPSDLAAMPRIAEAEFYGLYPVARLTFEDPGLPLDITLEAWNPFIPMNADDSGLPAAVLEYIVTNSGKKRVDGTIVWSMQNCCGWLGHPQGGMGMNVNEYIARDDLVGLNMTSNKYQPNELNYSSFALVSPCTNATWHTAWTEPGWWDKALRFWNFLKQEGKLEDGFTVSDPSPDNATHFGSLGLRFSLKPGETARLPFIISWHVPNRRWQSIVSTPDMPLVRNHYATKFGSAWDVAEYVAANYDHLRDQTLLFEESMSDGSLPGDVVDAVTSQASIIRSTTCMWLDDGRIYAYEGCGDHDGCCPMNCTHVWNYEQALAHLFPALERTMRDTDFLENIDPQTGAMAFRTAKPHAGGKDLWNIDTPACDGQNGCILKLYREWQQCGDTEWLRRLWPNAKKALEFAWGPKGWDRDGDGILEWRMHNTYDIEFYGPNTFTGIFFIAALKAAAEIAEAVGDLGAAEYYRQILPEISKKYDELLWNGSYYEQKVIEVDGKHPKYQYGRGCLSDHLLAQWFCEVAGLGKVLPAAHVRKALQSIFKFNFRADLSLHECVQRAYGLNDEAGLLLCTWPKGEREEFPFPYCDEMWTGFEYQVAAHLIYEGFVDEGLTIVSAARERHDGLKRNPWNEFECGNHYARAMSSWSLLLALSGFNYSAVNQSVCINPRISANDFRCFFTAGTGWGSFSQKLARGTLSVDFELAWGQTTLKKVSLVWPDAKIPKNVSVTAALDGESLPCTISMSKAAATVEFENAAAITAGSRLSVRIK